MQHEGPEVLALQGVDPLLIFPRAQGHDGQTLGLSPGEERGSMRTWQDRHLAGNRPNVGGPSTIGADTLLQHHVPELGVFDRPKHLFDLPAPCRVIGLEFCKRFLQTLEEVNAEIDGQTFDGERNKLGKCLQGLDQKIMDCRQYVKEYQRIRSNLHTLNESLDQLLKYSSTT